MPKRIAPQLTCLNGYTIMSHFWHFCPVFFQVKPDIQLRLQISHRNSPKLHPWYGIVVDCTQKIQMKMFTEKGPIVRIISPYLPQYIFLLAFERRWHHRTLPLVGENWVVCTLLSRSKFTNSKFDRSRMLICNYIMVCLHAFLRQSKTQ